MSQVTDMSNSSKQKSGDPILTIPVGDRGAFDDACAHAGSESTVRAAVICLSGGDLVDGRPEGEEAADRSVEHGMPALLAALQTPVVAALSGRIDDRVLELALAADVRVCDAGATFAMQYADKLWWLIILRSVGMVGSATVMAAVIVYATQVAPPHRRAESVGVIGLGGLVGMTIGPILGDWVFSSNTSLLPTYQRFFTISAACMAAGCLTIVNVGFRHRPARPR